VSGVDWTGVSMGRTIETNGVFLSFDACGEWVGAADASGDNERINAGRSLTIRIVDAKSQAPLWVVLEVG
jgi:hypothetical protein